MNPMGFSQNYLSFTIAMLRMNLKSNDGLVDIELYYVKKDCISLQ